MNKIWCVAALATCLHQQELGLAYISLSTDIKKGKTTSTNTYQIPLEEPYRAQPYSNETPSGLTFSAILYKKTKSMHSLSKSIRPFIGAKNFKESREFYKALEFEEIVIGDKLCLFKVNENLGFYLQDYYVEDWVNNTMVFLEVDEIERCAEELSNKGLQEKFKEVKFTEIKQFDWGRELVMIDPSGVLWHFSEFTK